MVLIKNRDYWLVNIKGKAKVQKKIKTSWYSFLIPILTLSIYFLSSATFLHH